MTEAPQQTTPAPESPQEDTRTFTQADLNKIAKREKGEGRNAAINDLLQKTGAESVEDLLSAYSEYQGIQEAVTTEADRERTAREKAEAKAKTAQERYEGTLRQYAVRDALRDSGINTGRLPLALKVADLSALELDADGNVSGVEGVVEAIREASPEWFADEQPARPVRSPEATQQRRVAENTYEGQMGGFLANILGAP